MRTTYVISGLLVLVAILNGAYGESEYEEILKRQWPVGDAESAQCPAINPKQQGRIPIGYTTNASFPNICGRANSARRLRPGVMCGTESIPNQWPWLALIGRKGERYYSGATLVHEKFIITSAHQFGDGTEDYPCKYTVRLGEHYLFNPDPNQVDHEVDNIFVHPQFDPLTKENDIAIVKLSRPANLSLNAIGPVCLPTSESQYPLNTTCYGAGWGAAGIDGDKFTTVHHLGVPLLHNGLCHNAYPGRIRHGTLCAGFSGGAPRDFCMSDYGGPLVCPNGNNGWDLVGVASWIDGCDTQPVPGVYTDVALNMNWINIIIAWNDHYHPRYPFN